jgi:peptide/nickel transport system substrate-binding protein
MRRGGTQGSSAAWRRPTGSIGLALVVALAALVGAGCGGSKSPSSTAKAGTGGTSAAKPGGTVTIGFYHDGYWDSIDPAMAYGLSTWEVTRQLCVPLLNYPNYGGAKGMDLVPAVAASMPQVSSDGLTYTFTIRPNLKFSNGAPLTANDVKYTFYRLFKLNGDAADIFSAVKGTDKVVAGKAKEVSGITAEGDQLTFHLSQPNGGFLQMLSLQFTCPVPTGTPVKQTETGKIPGNGPYMTQSYDPGRQLVMVRNPNYDPALGPKGNPDKLVFDLALDQSQALQKIKLGEIDLTFDGLPSADAQTALTDPTLKGRVFSSTSPTMTYAWMNNDVAPFDNAKVRQAINYAVDRTQIAKVVGGASAARATDQILPPALAGDSPKVYPLAPDLAKAKQLMQESGVSTPVKQTLDAPSTPGLPQVAQVIQADLQKIGIDLKINVGSATVLSAASAKRTSKRPAGFSSWTQDYPDAGDWLPLLDPRFVENGGQKARFHVDSFTPTFEALEKESGDQRQTGYQQLATKIMTDYAPWIPLFDTVVTTATSKHVGGYEWQPQVGVPVLTSLYVK